MLIKQYIHINICKHIPTSYNKNIRKLVLKEFDSPGSTSWLFFNCEMNIDTKVYIAKILDQIL